MSSFYTYDTLLIIVLVKMISYIYEYRPSYVLFEIYHSIYNKILQKLAFS